MNFLELAKKRYSVRRYQPRKVEREKLLTILEAGRMAPSAINRQPVKLIVVQEKDGLNKLKNSVTAYDAPLAIIVCGDHMAAGKRPYGEKKDVAEIDASIITDHMMLQATELGLGTVWICSFNPASLRKDFNIPDSLEPINILAIGYADEESDLPVPDEIAQKSLLHSRRKSLQDIVVYETL